jgi:hypothetical protein
LNAFFFFALDKPSERLQRTICLLKAYSIPVCRDY